MRLRRRSIGGLVETATTLDQALWHPTTRKGQSWQDFQDFATGSCGYAGTHYGASQRLTVPTVPSSPQAVRQRLLRLGLPGQSSYAPPEENDRHAVVSARPKVVDSDTESSLIRSSFDKTHQKYKRMPSLPPRDSPTLLDLSYLPCT
ncbi:hypothetical protein MJO28_010880 [Puccinia striiformis f. sp. tritici]|uniref:Uncharacterized protein n=1 Tax=Puccinia striiformis f. sp. tritici TaxID=168172 RepID=A0ACC0E688_9BASI|nr:hypothetical protein MJO28_010880 [Puccinia striiformis f. sp. tritici]